MRGECEAQFSTEFLLAKNREGVTDKTAEHMATVRMGENLANARALETIARNRLAG